MSKPGNGIPAHAKMVFQGVLFEVWQWEQKMYDGSTAIFEKLRRLPGAQIIATIEDKIILEIQKQPDNPKSFLCLPAGCANTWQETGEGLARRELLEETGYMSDDWTPWREEQPVRKIDWTVYTFIARNCVWKQKPVLDGGEIIETKLIDFEEFLMLSEDDTFRGRSLHPFLIRARFDPKYKEEFRTLIFGK